MTAIETNGSAIAGLETLDCDKALTEAVMLGLRDLETGMDAAIFQRRFGLPLKETLPEWNNLVQEGFLEEDANGFRLTLKGALVANEVFMRLLPR